MKSALGAVAILWFAVACGGPMTLISAPGGKCLGGEVLGDGVIAYGQFVIQPTQTADQYPPPFPLLTIPVSGGSPTTLVASEDYPILIGLDAKNLYYFSVGITVALKSAPLTGASPTILADNVVGPPVGTVQPYVTAFALDESYLYWVDDQLHELYSLPLNGGTPLALSSTMRVQFARSGTAYCAGSSLQSIPATGGSVTTLASLPADGPTNLVADDSFFYLSLGLLDGGTVIGRVPLDGGTFSTIASGLPVLLEIAVDPKASQFVYWSAAVRNTGSIGRTRVSDGKTVVLASDSVDPVSGAGIPTLAGVDGENVYWDWNCSLEKIAERP